ncbi:hypothetical protein KA478_04135 [Patescibacteria group bacterium]|nr:hypothetical protein [Patescibacteria group bacterium]
MAMVIALIVSSPYVLAGPERGATTHTFTVLGDEPSLWLASFCCPHPTNANVDNHTATSNSFFMGA